MPSSKGCRHVVFPKHEEWRYCKNPVKYRDPIGRGWCWRHSPTDYLKKLWTKIAHAAQA